jgi:hypothetical protein
MTEQEARQILGISEDEMGRDHEGLTIDGGVLFIF